MIDNKLIIIGNGFDSSLGLKTGYNHFMFDYIYNILNRLSTTHKKGWKLIWGEGSPMNNSDKYVYENELIKFEIPKGKIHFIKQLINENHSYKELSRILKKEKYLNYYFELFQDFHDNSINDNWTDIEVLYFDSLLNIFNKHSVVSTREREIKRFNNQFRILKEEFINYLKNIKFPWENIEPTSKEYIRYYKYYEEFLEPLLFFEKSDTELNETLVLNFNYTYTVESLINTFSIKGTDNIVHIHGTIDRLESIIFGFGDELDSNYKKLESERSNELFKYIKSPHYFQSENYKKLNLFINQPSRVYYVHILGHSCGISDRTLLNEIFERDECKEIRLYYYEYEEEIEKEVIVKTNKLDTSINIMKHFNNKILMREKINPFDKNDKMVQV